MNRADGVECPPNAVLQDFLDRRLEPAEAAVVRAHVSRCAVCASEVESLLTMGQAIRSLPPFDPGPEFSRRLLDRLRTAPPQGATRAGLRLSAAELGLVGSVSGAVAALLAMGTAWSLPPGLERLVGTLPDPVGVALSRLPALFERWLAGIAGWPAWLLPAAAVAVGAALASSVTIRFPASPSAKRSPRL
ncbi:MAG: zf-HC2 domain-containing protein [Armatimonadota bacterium]|nr:zf-HC2 domain-containing protein [Armatimonadota bacterium]